MKTNLWQTQFVGANLEPCMILLALAHRAAVVSSIKKTKLNQQVAVGKIRYHSRTTANDMMDDKFKKFDMSAA
nr:hypothetical protein Itr_chr12CG27350 [Ipomoea trifida]GMD61265.1 hypothetical protein Iba_chr12aCG19220 [Ipomoea batatas]GMD64383.1 hypothetical protein Iba_chr12bCG23860 [Ipomoea batatas]